MTPPTAAPLDVQRIVVDAWGTRILHGITMKLHPGEMCAIIGPSGAGKSTLVKVLLGLRSPASGTVRIGSGPVSEAGIVGYVPQYDALHETLTVRQALDYAAQLRLPALDEDGRQARIDELCGQVELSERLDVRIGALSGGQKKRVSVAMELLTDPVMLILDEPTSGLDPGLEAKMMALFAEVAARGRIVLVTTHAMQSLDCAAALLVLVKGRSAYFGPPTEATAFFRCEGYAGIFDQLPKRGPDAWSNTFARSPISGSFSSRSGPAPAVAPAQAAVPEAPQPQPSTGPPPRETPGQPSAEEQLAALKKKLGRG